ncbi:hypothetical protein NDU88_000847 [Pleurodeles waltl]|uniref:Reverse transcriptase domain-containing protein n=1 Tax=Pleurodeles waltl TaxID=8319 RepID=A0AAV7WIR9_PLEWA|nr:hypothetical protein NDU88_000847 [Pleurodeles waltl]
MRQGCSLSPLLFALAMELLAKLIREDPLVEGWSWPIGGVDRIALYADDVLLFLAKPASSGPRVMHLLELFAEASGRMLNPGKIALDPGGVASGAKMAVAL